MPVWIQRLKQKLQDTTNCVVPVDSETAAASVRDLERALSKAVAREVLPASSPVDYRVLLPQLGIFPAELLLITPGISAHDKPFRAARSGYFFDNQDAFWLPGDDIGFFDETLSWVIRTGDNGQTSLLQAEKPEA